MTNTTSASLRWPAAAWALPTVQATAGLRVTVREVPIQPLDPSRAEGVGSAMMVRTDPVQVVWSRPYSRSWTHVHWARFDLESEQLRTSAAGAGLRGDLIDWLPDRSRHAWFLLTHGLQRVDLDAMTPIETLSDGLPKWMSRLLPLGPGMLGVTGWTGGVITLVGTSPLQVRGRVRMPSPDAVWLREPGTLELLSFNGEVARTLGAAAPILGKPRRLPRGKGPLVEGDRAWIVCGTDGEEPRVPGIRSLRGDRVAEVTLPSGEVVRESPPLPGPESVKGIDRDGRLLVRCEQGFVLLDPTSLAPVLEARHSYGAFGDVSLLPDRTSAAVAPNAPAPERLLLVEWQSA